MLKASVIRGRNCNRAQALDHTITTVYSITSRNRSKFGTIMIVILWAYMSHHHWPYSIDLRVW